MRAICVCVLVVSALAAIGGCDGDSSSGSLLAQGTASVTTSTTVLATININQPGTLHGTIVWSGNPTELAMGFRHVASATTIGMSLGSSPTSSTVAVTSARVAAGTQWEVLAAAPSGPAVSVQFEVTFQAD
jgi:hypothetical protein